MISVDLLNTNRDGWVLRYTTKEGDRKQKKCKQKNSRGRERERQDLEDKLNSSTRGILWMDYLDIAEADYIPEMSPESVPKLRSAIRRLDEVLPKDFNMLDLDLAVMARFDTALKKRGVADATIKSMQGTIWALLRWGMDRDLIPRLVRPRKSRTKKAKSSITAKGRPLSQPETAAMREKVKSCVPHLHEATRYLRTFDAALLIGCRLAETQLLTWEKISKPCHYITGLDTDTPRIVFTEIQKNAKRQTVPLTNEAAEWLRSLEKDGPYVCRVKDNYGVYCDKRTPMRIIAEAGRRAGIVTKKDDDGNAIQHASLHDLRRTFAANLMDKLPINDVICLTRHSDPTTLLDFYVTSDVDELQDKLKNLT